ncbi:hypothetical protein C8F04DRAFT_1235371 [Mycena alexandri]|uniref:Secreted protein n=1 Tax=Mycena alexandri TaxID=1745969 RepID=A0AAD6SRK8_9AGAR|nr:hypothetical protein C8F04DRAFT_1235371 [Mycena alexandri]
MLASSFTFIAVSFLLAVNAAPLVERGSVVNHTSENHAPSPTAVETSPPWRRAALPASPFSEDRVVEPTPPGWRSAPTLTSILLERVAQPTPPGWRRASVAPQMQGYSSPIQADAPGWKKRATDADPTAFIILPPSNGPRINSLPHY